MNKSRETNKNERFVVAPTGQHDCVTASVLVKLHNHLVCCTCFFVFLVVRKRLRQKRKLSPQATDAILQFHNNGLRWRIKTDDWCCYRVLFLVPCFSLLWSYCSSFGRLAQRCNCSYGLWISFMLDSLSLWSFWHKDTQTAGFRFAQV